MRNIQRTNAIRWNNCDIRVFFEILSCMLFEYLNWRLGPSSIGKQRAYQQRHTYRGIGMFG